MAKGPTTDVDPPAAAGEKKGWFGRAVIIAGGVVVLLGVPAAFTNVFGLIKTLGPAEVQVRLTTCEPYRIILETRNVGGQPATVLHPDFLIRSPRGTRRPRMLSYVEVEPPDAGRVAANGHFLQTYDAHNPFFNREESEGGACRIEVSVPVSPDSGAHPNATGACRCVSS